MAARTDPYRNFRFRVLINGVAQAGFAKATGLGKEVAVAEYREGDDPPWKRKLAAKSDAKDVTLERGFVANDGDLWNLIQKSAHADGADNVSDYVGGVSGYHFDVSIEVMDKTSKVVKTVVLQSAWVKDYEVGDLDASSDDVLLNKVVLAVENFKDSGAAAAI